MDVLRKCVFACCLMLLPAFTHGASAEPIALSDPALQLSALGGDVSIYFAGSEAAYDLRLFETNAVSDGPYFPNHDTPIGTSHSLGMFTAGTQLNFMLDVLTTGDKFFTGPASLNPDNVIHARGQAFGGGQLWEGGPLVPASGVLVGFEDMRGGGDLDYNDFTFLVSNVTMSPVPEPATLLLLGGGLLGAFGASRRGRAGAREQVNG